MRYYIVAGEPSGDLHGSKIIAEILKRDPDAVFRFYGGDLMAAAAGSHGTLVRHYKDESIMGFVEVLKNLRKVLGSIGKCKMDIQAWNPDGVILIDYAGFNLRIAEFTKKLGIKTLFYIAPKVWAWKKHRVKLVRKFVDRLYVIFPFEVEYFSSRGIDTFFGGNPLMDEIAADSQKDIFESEKPIVALVPGSRVSEIDGNFPTMVEVARRMPEYDFYVTAVEWLDKKLYDAAIGGATNIHVVFNQMHKVLRSSVAALVCSGTATLETALMKLPQVVCYKANSFSITIAKIVVKIKWISLVNIIMDRTVVTELIQEDFTVDSALSELRSVLPGGEKHAALMEDYKKLADAVGGAGCSSRVAEDMVKYLAK